eukprot:3709563-Rhodomonas_salina.1
MKHDGPRIGNRNVGMHQMDWEGRRRVGVKEGCGADLARRDRESGRGGCVEGDSPVLVLCHARGWETARGEAT